jgi:hypothetical protein
VETIQTRKKCLIGESIKQFINYPYINDNYMKNLISKVIIPAIAIVILAGCSSKNYTDIFTDEDDTDYIMAMAEKILSTGLRVAGSEAEKMTADLITGELNSMNIASTREEFTFGSYDIDHISITFDGVELLPEFAGINPFEGDVSMSGPIVIQDAEVDAVGSPEGKIMISNNPGLFFMALQAGCKAFFSFKQEDFERIIALGTGTATVSATGKALALPTCNIIADIGKNPSSSGFVYITAHYDSYLESRGANDNATGVGGLLAMARILKSCEKSLPVNVRLIFFGAEEVGLVGSREYVADHLDELGECKLLINFDTFGGNEAPYIATAKGVQGVPMSGIANQLDPVISNRALEGPNGKWRLFHPSIFPMVMASNYPEWVQEIVDSAGTSLEVTVYNAHLMSDHLSFAGAGVPAISIQSRKHSIHSAEDTFENINSESVASCFGLSLEILKRVMAREMKI